MTRRLTRALAALLALGLLVGGPPANAGLADRVGATFVLVAEDFVRAFQPVEGLVVGVEGDALYLDLGEGRGAQTGQELTIFRRGEEFHHPVTGKPLGHYEEALGWAQIRRVQARFSEAVYVPLEGKPRPQADDGVRITRGRIRIAITPVLDRARAHFHQADAVMGRCPPRFVRTPRLMEKAYQVLLRKLTARGWAPPRAKVSIGKLRLLWIVARYGLL